MMRKELEAASCRLALLRTLQAEADAPPLPENDPFSGIKFIIGRHAISGTNKKRAKAEVEAIAAGRDAHDIDKHFYREKPDNEVCLEAEGKNQARASGLLLKTLFTEPGPLKTGTGLYIVVSPFERTQQTWQEVSPSLAAIPYVVLNDPRIREKRFGEWDGLSNQERREISPEIYAAFKELGSYYVAPPGGESGRMIEQRVKAALINAAAEARRNGFDTVVLITHRPVLEYASLILMGLPGNWIKDFPKDFENCAMVSVINRQLRVLHHGFEPESALDLKQILPRYKTEEPEPAFA